MKITKTVCDWCGIDITEKHPARIRIETYNEKQRMYTPTEKYEICEACKNEIEIRLKGEVYDV